MKLYRNATDLDHWYVPVSGRRWCMFPARINGWFERRSARRVDAADLREVPLWLAFNTGLLETVRQPSRAPIRPVEDRAARQQAA